MYQLEIDYIFDKYQTCSRWDPLNRDRFYRVPCEEQIQFDSERRDETGAINK